MYVMESLQENILNSFFVCLFFRHSTNSWLYWRHPEGLPGAHQLQLQHRQPGLPLPFTQPLPIPRPPLLLVFLLRPPPQGHGGSPPQPQPAQCQPRGGGAPKCTSWAQQDGGRPMPQAPSRSHQRADRRNRRTRAQETKLAIWDTPASARSGRAGVHIGDTPRLLSAAD